MGTVREDDDTVTVRITATLVGGDTLSEDTTVGRCGHEDRPRRFLDSDYTATDPGSHHHHRRELQYSGTGTFTLTLLDDADGRIGRRRSR